MLRCGDFGADLVFFSQAEDLEAGVGKIISGNNGGEFLLSAHGYPVRYCDQSSGILFGVFAGADL